MNDPQYAELLLYIGGDAEFDPIIEDYIVLDQIIINKANIVEMFINEVFREGLDTVHGYCYLQIIQLRYIS